MGPSFGEVVAIVVTVLTPAVLILYMAKRWFGLKEKRLEIDALIAGEKSGHHASRTGDIEARLATLERIVTDGPLRLSDEIDALGGHHQAQRIKDLA